MVFMCNDGPQAHEKGCGLQAASSLQSSISYSYQEMHLKYSAALWLKFILILIGLVLVQSHAQVTVIVQEKVSISRVLAGHVKIGVEKIAAEGISVEARSSEGKVLALTKTDANGFFRIDSPRQSGLIHLRLFAPGVNPYELRVKLIRFGPSKLYIYMNTAT